MRFFSGGRECVCSRASWRRPRDRARHGACNLRYYRSGVRLTGVELNAYTLAVARERATDLGCDADLRVGDAQELPYEEASFDTVVSTLSLCSIPD